MILRQGESHIGESNNFGVDDGRFRADWCYKINRSFKWSF